MGAKISRELIKDFSGVCFETLGRVLLSILKVVLLAGIAFGLLWAGFLLTGADL